MSLPFYPEHDAQKAPSEENWYEFRKGAQRAALGAYCESLVKSAPGLTLFLPNDISLLSGHVGKWAEWHSSAKGAQPAVVQNIDLWFGPITNEFDAPKDTIENPLLKRYGQLIAIYLPRRNFSVDWVLLDLSGVDFASAQKSIVELSTESKIVAAKPNTSAL